MSPRIGSLLYVVAETGTPQPLESDDESTEPVNHRKPVMDAPIPMMEEYLWWQMNQDFALDSDEEEGYIVPTSRNVALDIPAGVARTSSPLLVGADDEWMAMNQDFACDHSHDDEMEVDERLAPTKKVVPSLREPLGDYGVWWE